MVSTIKIYISNLAVFEIAQISTASGPRLPRHALVQMRVLIPDHSSQVKAHGLRKMSTHQEGKTEHLYAVSSTNLGMKYSLRAKSSQVSQYQRSWPMRQ